nr:hypothetical protein [Azospirillum sp. INR13]
MLDMLHVEDVAVQPAFRVRLAGDDHAVTVQDHDAGVRLLQHLHQIRQPGEVDRHADHADDPSVLHDRAGDDDQRLQRALADDEVADHPVLRVEDALEILAFAQRDAGTGAGGVADDVAVGIGQPDAGGPAVLARHRRQGGDAGIGIGRRRVTDRRNQRQHAEQVARLPDQVALALHPVVGEVQGQFARRIDAVVELLVRQVERARQRQRQRRQHDAHQACAQAARTEGVEKAGQQTGGHGSGALRGNGRRHTRA